MRRNLKSYFKRVGTIGLFMALFIFLLFTVPIFTGTIEYAFADEGNCYLQGENGEVLLYSGDGPATEVTGLVQVQGKYCYFEKGVLKKVSGMVKDYKDGSWHFVKDGIFTERTGLVKAVQPGTEFTSKWFYVAEGNLSEETGLVLCVQPGSSAEGKWYFVRDGKQDKSPAATGLVKCIQGNSAQKGNWFYVKNGTRRTGEKITGMVKCIQPGDSYGQYYYVKNGKMLRDGITGLVKCIQPEDEKKDKWFYLKNGKLYTDKKNSGLVKCIQPKSSSKGKYYYVHRGELVNSDKVTGLVKCIQPKDSKKNKWFYVVNGKLNSNKPKTGLVKCIQPLSESKGNYYFVTDNQLDKSTGVVKCIQPKSDSKGNYYYVSKGKKRDITTIARSIQPDSTKGRLCYVENGRYLPDYSGLAQIGSSYYYIDRGIVPSGTPSITNGTFILISIGQQQMWYFERGNMVITTPVVTGRTDLWPTPTGTFSVVAKGKHVRMVGPTWASTATWWMGIENTHYYAIHSSSRTAYGGTIYKNSGSHGCINTPPPAAEVFYDRVSRGTRIYIRSY